MVFNLMHFRERKSFCLVCCALVVFLTGCFLVSAGVVVYYPKEKPLLINQGEEREIAIASLQNLREDAKVFELSVVSGQDFAELVQSYYDLEPGKSDVLVYLNIKMPENALPGSSEKVIVNLKERLRDDSSKSGSVGFSSSMNFEVNLLVPGSVSEPEEELKGFSGLFFLFFIVFISVLILIIIFLIYYLLKRKKLNYF